MTGSSELRGQPAFLELLDDVEKIEVGPPEHPVHVLLIARVPLPLASDRGVGGYRELHSRSEPDEEVLFHGLAELDLRHGDRLEVLHDQRGRGLERSGRGTVGSEGLAGGDQGG